VAFNASLSLQILEDVEYLGIDWDAKARSIVFHVSSGTYKGEQAHRLINDGGGQTKGRALYLPATAITPSEVPTGRYPAALGRNKFTIKY
jgi:hypothetical protein